MRHKTFELVEVKADGEGQFTALASVFGNVDLGGDRMLPGAFTKTLDWWRSSGNPIPIVFSHQWDDPMAYVGKADPRAVYETDDGLVVQGQLDTSDDVGRKVYGLMKDRLITGWSFGYTVPDGGEEFNDGVNDVSEVALIEAGPTLKGMNPEAQLQAIKSLQPEWVKPLIARIEVLEQNNASNGKATVEITTPPDEGPEDEAPANGSEDDPPPKATDSLKEEIDRVWVEAHFG